MSIESIAYAYMEFMTRFKNMIRHIRLLILNTYDVMIIDIKTGQPKSIILRYYCVKALNTILLWLKTLRDYIDIDSTKIHIVKEYQNGTQGIILDGNIVSGVNTDNSGTVNLSNIIKWIDSNGKKEESLGKYVFRKFELRSSSGSSEEKEKSICLKQCIMKYKDFDNLYHHSLKNILEFNGLSDKAADNSIIHISIFERGKMRVYDLCYRDVKEHHITYFYNLD